jgi:hypothetical protein
VLTLLDAANQLIHQVLTTEVLQHPPSVRLCRHASVFQMELAQMRPLLSARQSREVELPISNHFVFTRAAASLSSRRKQGQIAARKVSAFLTAVKCD